MVVEDEGGAAAADGPETAVAGVARPANLVLGRHVRGQVEHHPRIPARMDAECATRAHLPVLTRAHEHLAHLVAPALDRFASSSEACAQHCYGEDLHGQHGGRRVAVGYRRNAAEAATAARLTTALEAGHAHDPGNSLYIVRSKPLGACASLSPQCTGMGRTQTRRAQGSIQDDVWLWFDHNRLAASMLKGSAMGVVGAWFEGSGLSQAVGAASAPASNAVPRTLWGQIVAWVDPSDPVYFTMLKYALGGAGLAAMQDTTFLPPPADTEQRRERQCRGRGPRTRRRTGRY